MARDAQAQASAEEISSLTAALRHQLNEPSSAGAWDSLTGELIGPWRPLVFSLRGIPADEWEGGVTFLLWILDDAVGTSVR